MPYISTKTYGHEIGLSCCFRQHRAESHCRFLHGYALKVRVEFEAEELDERNWVVDFGALKGFREWLEAVFDHKMLVANDDPKRVLLREIEMAGLCEIVYVPAVGCEAFAKIIYDQAGEWLMHKGYRGVRVRSVEVAEHGANSAIYMENDNGKARLPRRVNIQQSRSSHVA